MKRIFGIGLLLTVTLVWLGISNASAQQQGGVKILWENTMSSTTDWGVSNNLSVSTDGDVATVSVPEDIWGGRLIRGDVAGVSEPGTYIGLRIKVPTNVWYSVDLYTGNWQTVVSKNWTAGSGDWETVIIPVPPGPFGRDGDDLHIGVSAPGDNRSVQIDYVGIYRDDDTLPADLVLWENTMSSTTDWGVSGISISTDGDVATLFSPASIWGGWLIRGDVAGVSELGTFIGLRIKVPTDVWYTLNLFTGNWQTVAIKGWTAGSGDWEIVTIPVPPGPFGRIGDDLHIGISAPGTSRSVQVDYVGIYVNKPPVSGDVFVTPTEINLSKKPGTRNLTIHVLDSSGNLDATEGAGAEVEINGISEDVIALLGDVEPDGYAIQVRIPDSVMAIDGKVTINLLSIGDEEMTYADGVDSLIVMPVKVLDRKGDQSRGEAWWK